MFYLEKTLFSAVAAMAALSGCLPSANVTMTAPQAQASRNSSSPALSPSPSPTSSAREVVQFDEAATRARFLRSGSSESHFDRELTYAARDLSHHAGFEDGDGWAIRTDVYPRGHMVYGPFATDWGGGAGEVTFRLMVDVAGTPDDLIAAIEIYDSTARQIIATRTLYRQSWSAPMQYQDFTLPFDLAGRSSHRMETRVWWFGNTYLRVGEVRVGLDEFRAGLPQVVNRSASSDSRVKWLVERAIQGLGFNANGRDGPNANDLIFTNRHYLAWIDQTGFYGKINAVWRLNGGLGNALDFALTDARGRPMSALAPGEFGDGKWLAGYMGAEHFEIPDEVPEPGEDRNGNGQCDTDESCSGAACVKKICNWYSMNEAIKITDSDVPWWSACNSNKPSWARKLLPVFWENTSDGLRVLYEGGIRKEADGDGNLDGDSCHDHYRFRDGHRRPVNLRVGYVFYNDQPYFDRIYQFRNPAGNPTFGTDVWSVIGGYVLTQYPGGPLSKQVYRYVRPQDRELTHGTHPVRFSSGTWTATGVSSLEQDLVYGWVGQPFSLSTSAQYRTGASIGLANLGVTDNDDSGFCFCTVHGGFEIGGGLLHRDLSLPVAPGQVSPEGVRRIIFPDDHASDLGDFLH